VCHVGVIPFLYYLLVCHQRNAAFAGQPLRKYFHLGAWGIAAIFSITAAGTHSLDYGYSTRIYCFINIDLSRSLYIDYSLFYIPMTIIIFSVLFVFCLVVRRIVKYQIEGREFGGGMPMRAQYRVIAVAAIVFIVFCLVFIFRYSYNAHETTLDIENTKAWVECKVKAELTHTPYPPSCNTNINPKRRALSSVTMQNMSNGVMGIFIFLAFGTDPVIYLQWFTIWKCLYQRNMTKLWNSVYHGYSFEVIPPTRSPESSKGTAKETSNTTEGSGLSMATDRSMSSASTV